MGQQREMKSKILFFTGLFFAVSATDVLAASCSIANLTRCLDSACAINLSSNPAARCQYCGTSDAGEPATGNAMRSVSVGASAKYNFTDKELKKAPTDPGERYAWATAECLKKVSGCTPDDVTDNYDELIEQSCRAAGVTAQRDNALIAASKTKTKTTCKTDINSCIVANNKCNADFSQCTEDANFDKFFAECSVLATGCDEHLSAIRGEIIASRDTYVKNAEAMIASIVESYKQERASKLASIKSNCRDNSGFDACVETVCSTNMPNKCETSDFGKSERSVANQLCTFHKLACETINKL